MNTAKAVIEDIQKNYSLHRDDLECRRLNPHSEESKRQEAWIKRFESMLKLYFHYIECSNFQDFDAALHRPNALYS